MFHAPSKYIPLKLAREIDDSNQDAATVGDHVGSSIDRNAYIQPCLEPGVRTPETWDDNVDPDAKVNRLSFMLSFRVPYSTCNTCSTDCLFDRKCFCSYSSPFCIIYNI